MITFWQFIENFDREASERARRTYSITTDDSYYPGMRVSYNWGEWDRVDEFTKSVLLWQLLKHCVLIDFDMDGVCAAERLLLRRKPPKNKEKYIIQHTECKSFPPRYGGLTGPPVPEDDDFDRPAPREILDCITWVDNQNEEHPLSSWDRAISGNKFGYEFHGGIDQSRLQSRHFDFANKDPELTQMLKALNNTNPKQAGHFLILADKLDETGNGDEAEFVRRVIQHIESVREDGGFWNPNKQPPDYEDAHIQSMLNALLNRIMQLIQT